MDDLNDYYKGFVVNHAITRELIANAALPGSRPLFWVREIEACTIRKGKSFSLLNLPYFACTHLDRIGMWNGQSAKIENRLADVGNYPDMLQQSPPPAS